MEQIDGMATYDGAARILGCSYWQVVHCIKKHDVKTMKLAGSKTLLVKLADLAELKQKS